VKSDPLARRFRAKPGTFVQPGLRDDPDDARFFYDNNPGSPGSIAVRQPDHVMRHGSYTATGSAKRGDVFFFDCDACGRSHRNSKGDCT
jgi:hypothetical protein